MTWPAWSLSGDERDDRDFRALPSDLNDLDLWRIEGVGRAEQEERADAEEAAMQRGWNW